MIISNNWRRNHGLPLAETKRYPNERKDMPKKVRVCYHGMLRAGCDMADIKRRLKKWHGFDWDIRA